MNKFTNMTLDYAVRAKSDLVTQNPEFTLSLYAGACDSLTLL